MICGHMLLSHEGLQVCPSNSVYSIVDRTYNYSPIDLSLISQPYSHN